MNHDVALQPIIEDYLESLERTSALALSELITCVLRTCGSNDTVDQDRVVDYDGIVDALDDFTEVLKEDEAPTYPLTSKHPMFKKFRKSLSEFLSRLIRSAAESGSLYTSDLILTIQSWVIAMSSSQLRSFRHTATVIALEIETALCEVASAVEKEAELITRQREGERKRKGKGGGALSGREKEIEKKAADVKSRRNKLSEYLKEFFDGSGRVFSACSFSGLTFFTGYLFIDIVTWTRISVLIVYMLSVTGSRHSLRISSTANISDT